MDNQEQRCEQLLGFYSLRPTEDDTGYLGALLVTNEKGVPEEFRCTHVVRPNPVQRMLYGEALLPYIGVTLCGSPLYRSLQTKPDVLFV